ncbi:MAG: DedA family protein [Prevotella sp.]|nr:DedA family protein [Prevotella sp.]
MLTMLDFLIQYGPFGMFIASFIAGSVFPFSSEAIMLAMLAAGVEPIELTIYATVGNVLGSMFNYCVGRMGRLDWIEKYLHVKKEKLDRAQRFMGGHGAWMGFFTFLPILGSAISILLGLMRANVLITLISIFLGKSLRYIVLASPFLL